MATTLPSSTSLLAARSREDLLHQALLTTTDDRSFADVPVDCWEEPARLWRPTSIVRVLGGVGDVRRDVEVLTPGLEGTALRRVSFAHTRLSRLLTAGVSRYWVARYQLQLVRRIIEQSPAAGAELDSLHDLSARLAHEEALSYDIWVTAYLAGAADDVDHEPEVPFLVDDGEMELVYDGQPAVLIHVAEQILAADLLRLDASLAAAGTTKAERAAHPLPALIISMLLRAPVAAEPLAQPEALTPAEPVIQAEPLTEEVPLAQLEPVIQAEARASEVPLALTELVIDAEALAEEEPLTEAELIPMEALDQTDGLTQAEPAAPGEPTPTTLEQLPIEPDVLDQPQPDEPLGIQQEEGRLLQTALAAAETPQADVWSAIRNLRGIPTIRLETQRIDPEVANRIDAREALKYGVLPMRVAGSRVVVAMADPWDGNALEYLEGRMGMPVLPKLASPASIRKQQENVYRAQLEEVSSRHLQTSAPEYSAHFTLSRPQRIALIVLGIVAVNLLVLMRFNFFIAITGALIALYAAVVIFRIYVIVRGAKSEELITVSHEEIAALKNLPIYTILLPLYREAGVLPQLIEACRALDYPEAKLDIKLLLEEDDDATLAAVRDTELPPSFDVLLVPAEGPRTKPKACNYGLQFARGEYCVIYDAEDIPAPDQLKKALAVFRRSGPRVGCVQAKLNYYNPEQNAITKWFALEYTSWFDFFLPGLVSLRLPVPLGGSSNHFPTRLLVDLGAWDPNNVTEDADLGMRLHRSGYRTALMDSLTLEEANSDFTNWMRQRSRWGKGYFISWLVLMRHPWQLVRDVGLRATLSMQLTLGGTFGVALLNLGVWFLTLLWILAQFKIIAYLFPTWIYYAGMIEMIFGNFFFLYMGLWAARHRRSFTLNHAALLTPLYWLMASVAMIKATLQTASRPHYWEKTVHGLFEPPVPSVALEGSPSARSRTGVAGDV